MPPGGEGRGQEMTANGMWRGAGLLLLVIGLTACQENKLSPPVEGWLHCDECTDGERAAVRALGEQAVPELARALLDGPPASNREVVRQEAVRAHSRAGVGTLSASEYATQMVSNYVAKYQGRAAVALGDIGTSSARSALDAALQPPHSAQYRADVLQKIKLARTAIGATPFGGRFERRMVQFADTAFLLAPPAQPFATNDVIALDDSAPAELVLTRQPGRVGFAAVGMAGPHLVSVRRAGTSTTEVTDLTILSNSDATDRAVKGCATLACEVSASPILPAGAQPVQTFLSLWSSPPHRDSLDIFRFLSPTSHQVTARLEWTGAANLDLLWRTCSNLTPVGNTDGATAAKPEQTTVTIPGTVCWALFVVQKSQLPEPTLASLRVTSP